MKRPNASKWDLSPELVQWFAEAMDIAGAYKWAHRLPEVPLVNIIEYYLADCKFANREPSKDFFLQCVDAFCDRRMITVSNLAEMLDGTKTLKYETNTNNNGRGGYRNTANEAGEERRRAAASQRSSSLYGKPLALKELEFGADGIQPSRRAMNGTPSKYYNRQRALDWMLANKPDDLDHWEDYFEFAGILAGVGEAYILRGSKSGSLRFPPSGGRVEPKEDLDQLDQQLQ
jgi:hypothetical protein